MIHDNKLLKTTSSLPKKNEEGVFSFRAAASTNEHNIVVRDRRFNRQPSTNRWWHSNDPIATAWYNSVSASLPRGEAFFIDTMREFRDLLPADLRRDVQMFIKQEINHTREHVAFNRLLSSHGYDVESIDRGIHEMLALTKGRPQEFNLAITIALEHFAAVISHQLLADPGYLDGADANAAALWRWHASEEIEHKGLAYDIWRHATKDWSKWRRYRVKTLLALLITRKYFRNRIADALGLLAQDGITGMRAKLRLYYFLWAKPGMIRRMFGDWARILWPGFHPWKVDDRHLIADEASTLNKA